ncbi:MAG: P-loop NTPase [Candidatus Odinarchaeia archaeon]
MQLPEFLKTQLQAGRVILYLGSGASLSATDDNGNHPPSSAELAKYLSIRFLGGKYETEPLSTVSELAISESDLFSVQDYIKQIFEKFKPSETHLKMTKLRWKTIVTTNFDLLIEQAYAQIPDKIQDIVPFVENGDRVEEKLTGLDAVALIKLHGCINRISNEKCPLILTPDQYIQYKKCRDRLFNRFQDWAHEYPIVFIGSSLNDYDLRTTLISLSTNVENRPRYFSVTPNVDEIEERHWSQKRITTLKGTFHEFITEVSKSLIGPFYRLSKDMPSGLIRKARIKDASFSENCMRFLTMDAEPVESASPETIDPKSFYKGHSYRWAAIDQNLDVYREIVDNVISDYLLDHERISDNLEIIMIKGHAGSGKTIVLERIAWEVSNTFEGIVFFIKQVGSINSGPIQELVEIFRQRIYIFVDDLPNRVGEIIRLASELRVESKRITIITAARTNEWNMIRDRLNDHITTEYELGYLSEREIDTLLGKLRQYKALGNLSGASEEEQKSAFAERAGRQLLVALHEATLGKPFEEIIRDEYENIIPEEAKSIYLTVCTLNRLNVPVRAGIIARVHGVAFEDFKVRFFKPLENVVMSRYSYEIQDYQYSSRHPHIAEIVFDTVLLDPEERLRIYSRTLNALDIDYRADRYAFRRMINARNLLEMFTDHQMVKSIFDIAERNADDFAFLYHQLAVYEMNRENGNLHQAYALLKKAIDHSPENKSFRHSLAELQLRRGEESKNEIEKQKYLNEATKIAKQLINQSKSETYPYHTLLKIYTERIRYLLKEDSNNTSLFEDTLVKAEKLLTEARQRFPEDSYILDSDARIAQILNDAERALAALKKAFNSNPRNTFVALRLAKHYRMQKDYIKAKSVLKKSIESNPGDKRLNFEYSTLLIATENANQDEIIYHLRRSFTKGDHNYVAQILYGSQLYCSNKIKEAHNHFSSLRGNQYPTYILNHPLYILESKYRGEIKTLSTSFGFIIRDSTRDDIYFQRKAIQQDIWRKLTIGTKVEFSMGFTICGPKAIDVSLI